MTINALHPNFELKIIENKNHLSKSNKMLFQKYGAEFESMLLFITFSGFMYTSMIPAEVFMEYEAIPMKAREQQPDGIVAAAIDALNYFFAYELKSSVSVKLEFEKLKWWWPVLPSLFLIATNKNSNTSTNICTEYFSAIALWWLLTEGFFLLKSMAILVDAVKMLNDSEAVVHSNLLAFGMVLAFYVITYMYLASELWVVRRNQCTRKKLDSK